MSQNLRGVCSNPVVDQTAALIANAAAVSSHLANKSLGDLLRVISSNETGQQDIDESFSLIRRELESIAVVQADEEDKIKSILKSVLDGEVLEHLEKELEKQVDECVDEIVAQLVDAHIGKYVPKSLRESIDRQRTELDSAHTQLHNVGARQQNATIQTRKHLGEPLHHLLGENATKSEPFPESVNKLLEFNDGELFELVRFYGKSDPDKNSRGENVDWFLRFSGVTFQYMHG